KIPFDQWYESLSDAKTQYKIDARLERIVLLLFGGDKSTQKQDIRQAQEYWKDYDKH
ncbi:MAG: type II toxin-antitoxin system RelE/ParE family toxin, partial [Planktothrix sp.]